MELDLGSNSQLMGEFRKLSEEIAANGERFYSRGWLMGTSGNLSAVVSRNPMLLAITGSGLDKGSLTPDQIILIDQGMKVISGNYRPSAETALHLTLAKETSCGAVFHTHSVWSTILSREHQKEGGLWIENLEMLKSLDGVRTHQHREWIPILPNSQDMDELSEELKDTLKSGNTVHGFMLSGHGLYAWGKDTQEAKRHTEGLEFLLEVQGRTSGMSQG